MVLNVKPQAVVETFEPTTILSRTCGGGRAEGEVTLRFLTHSTCKCEVHSNGQEPRVACAN